jgi:hypothetical protein
MAFNYSPKIVTDGLVLYLDAANTRSYPGTGTVWSDLSRGGNNGSLINGPTFNSANGGSIVFDGVNDYVRIPFAKNILPQTDITIFTWQYLTARDSTIMMASDGTGNNELILYNGFSGLLSDKFGVGINSPAGTTTWLVSNLTPPLNIWTNICVTRNGTTVNLYFNAVFDNTNTQTGNIQPGNNSPLLIGVDADSGDEGSLGNYFNGRIAQTSIYNRALSATEVLQNYNATKGRYL